jgi:hypothetical protein
MGMNRLLRRTLLQRTGVALLAGLLAACSPPPPFQPQVPGTLSYGYGEAKLDALHYSVLYTDSTAQRAETNLKLRAAQLAQAAGYAYFVFDTKGVASQRKTDTEFTRDPTSNINRRGGPLGANALNDFKDPSTLQSVTLYYSAAGRISLLTPEEARGKPDAIAVADVLKGAP